METPKKDEINTTNTPEEKKEGVVKKKKNIIRVFHGENASGPIRKKRPAGPRPEGERGARPARPASQKAGEGAKASEAAKPIASPASKAPEAAKTSEAVKSAATSAPKASEAVKPAATPASKAPEAVKPAASPAPKAPETARAPRTEAPRSAEGTRPVQGSRPVSQARPQGGARPSDGSRAPMQGRPSDGNRAPRADQGTGRTAFRSTRTDNRPGERRGEFRPGERREGARPQGQRYQGQGQGSYQGQRPPRQGDGPFRSTRPQDGTNRFARPTDGSRPDNRRPYGQGRPGMGGRPDGRPGDNRFGQNRPAGGARPAGRRPGEAAFAPDLSKAAKDSKRERDRENKNKKRDFEPGSTDSRRPNQGGRRAPQHGTKGFGKPANAPKEVKKPEIKEITIPEKLTIRELADAMKIQASAIVKKLFLEGNVVTVNQEIDFEKAEEIALSFDIVAEKEIPEDLIGNALADVEDPEESLVARPPVVCVMGHVDHGKTSLLDAIRKTNVTRGEAGGITQHIGASVVQINGQNITFLDTPGHEAFTAMRMRGANSTDIAVLVVAADDGVMPQTVEAISHAKAAGVEIIVAINKMDKPSANIERVKQELSEYELIPEDWGGSTICVPVSAHTGEGIDTLLEMILLTAEVSELKANPNRAARGLVIEAQLDKGKGPVATILVQKGTLHVGDFIAAGACSGKVRAMMDDKGRRVKEAGPSTPVEILGLSDVPNAGEVLKCFDTDKDAKNFASLFISENKKQLLDETKGKLSLDNLFDQIHASDLKELPLIIKADVQGSVEAVRQSLTKLSNEEVVVKVIHGGVGAINESDVSLAATSNAIIIGFNVRPDATAKQLAEQEKVDLRLYRVIYQAIEDVQAAMKGMLDPIFEEKVIGHAEVRQIFKASGIGTIAGSYVLDGIFQRNCKVRITREGEQIYEGALASLKRFKDDVKEVKAGYECGLVFEGFHDVKEEDKIEAYIMVEVPR